MSYSWPLLTDFPNRNSKFYNRSCVRRECRVENALVRPSEGLSNQDPISSSISIVYFKWSLLSSVLELAQENFLKKALRTLASFIIYGRIFLHLIALSYFDLLWSLIGNLNSVIANRLFIIIMELIFFSRLLKKQTKWRFRLNRDSWSFSLFPRCRNRVYSLRCFLLLCHAPKERNYFSCFVNTVTVPPRNSSFWSWRLSATRDPP